MKKTHFLLLTYSTVLQTAWLLGFFRVRRCESPLTRLTKNRLKKGVKNELCLIINTLISSNRVSE
jgi:hypothetical protein